MAQIFISYAREDEQRIQPIVNAFENEGWSVFWDQHIPAGKTWRSYIGKALSEARCVVVVWSRHSTTSSWVSEEADEGKQRGILVPILLDPVEPPIGFRSIQAADLTGWNPQTCSADFEHLARDIREILTTHSASPAPQLPVTPKATSALTHQNNIETLGQPSYLLALSGLVLAGIIGAYLVYQSIPSKPADLASPIKNIPTGDWGVVLGSDKTVVAAQDEITRAASKGIPSASLYLRNGYYVSIAVANNQALANEYLSIAKTFRPDAYIITSMKTWCPNPKPVEGFTDCQGNR